MTAPIGRLFLPVLAAGVLLSLRPQAVLPQDPALAPMWQKWKEKDYGKVAQDLAAYRETHTRSPEADYLLATSLCRSGERARGRALLDWMLSEWTQGQPYRLVQGEIDVVKKEVSVCQPSLFVPPAPGGSASTSPIAVPPFPSPGPGGTSVIIIPRGELALPAPSTPK